MTDDQSRSYSTGDGYSYLDPLVLQQRRYAVAVVIAVSVMVLVSGLAAFFLYRPVKVSQQQLIEIVEKAIEMQISSSSSLQFDDVRVTQRDEGYEVTGSVDAIAPGGETGRFRFTCLVQKRGDGAWTPNKWEVTRQR
jgi:hypothetical protein